MVSDSDLYRHSSQFRLWSFTPEELDKRRRSVHEQARAVVEAEIATHSDEAVLIDCISYDEEQALVAFYASKVDPIAKAFQMSSHVKATATSFFLKFYLVNSVLQFHPRMVLYTCVFLAAKAENSFVGIRRFCDSLQRVEPKDILDLEFGVLQALSFTLAVHNGLRPLHGFFLDMQVTLPDVTPLQLGKYHDAARLLIVTGFRSDSVFLFTPPQIALAALHISNPEMTMTYLRLRYPDETVLSNLVQIIVDCSTELVRVRDVPSDQGNSIDRKLHACTNIEKHIRSVKRKLDKDSQDDVKRPRTE